MMLPGRLPLTRLMQRGRPDAPAPVALPPALTPEHERVRVMALRLHRAWHNDTVCAPPCDYHARAVVIVRMLPPLVDMYLVEAVEQARADLAREWGE